MKTLSVLFAMFNRKSTADKVNEEKASVLAETSSPVQKTFGAVDLWKIQRNGKTSLYRRNFSLS